MINDNNNIIVDGQNNIKNYNNNSNLNLDTKGTIKFDQNHSLKDILISNAKFKENFELLDYVGSGSESKVYKGIVKKNRKIIVIKIIDNEQSHDNKNELEISSKLRHKNIINNYCSDIDNNICYIVMENAEFGNINDFMRNIINKTYLSEQMLCYLAYNILNGIIYCHKNKVAHRDIKPNNIVVDKFINIKLIDFSISLNYQKYKPYDKIKLSLKGTNFYIPIEVIAKQRIKCKDLNKIDIYSFGVLLYYLAFQKYPYNLEKDDADDYDKIYKNIYKNDIGIDKENKEFSLAFYDFLSKIIEKDIYNRMDIYAARDHYWIKGAHILLAEKEKILNINTFISYLLSNHIKAFNDYIQRYNKSK